jgi:two-component system, sensor histidine kinase
MSPVCPRRQNPDAPLIQDAMSKRGNQDSRLTRCPFPEDPMFSRLLHGSIKKKLAILFLMAALPAMVIIVFAALENSRRAVSNAQQELQAFSRHIAEVQTQTTLATRSLLEGLALLPEVRQAKAEECNRLFANILKINPLYAALHLVDGNGELAASATARGPANFAHTPHFKGAMATRTFATGEYIVGVTLHVPVFTFAYPILDDQDEVAGVLLTSIRLDRYAELFKHTRFPENSFVGVCDRNGTRLFRYPENPATLPGEPIKTEVFAQAAAGPQEGLLRETGSDGVLRIVAFQQLRLTPDQPPYMYFFAGTPSRAFYAVAQKGMLRDLGILFLAIGLTLLCGWFLGGRTVAARLEELAGASKRIGEGDLSARVAPAPEITEIDVLAGAFNNMAESLARDIVRREAAEEALLESEARFRNLFEEVPSVAVQGYGMDGVTRYWNRASEHFYGYSRDEAIGKKLVELIIPPEMRDDVNAAMAAMAETKIPIPASELTLMRKDGTRVVVFSSHSIVMKPGGQAELFCLDVDLTHRKEAEEALLKLKEAAESANQAKSEFLANMSHEIRTPINGVMGMLQLLETTPLDPDQSGYVRMAAEAAKRLTGLLSDILDLSRVEAGRMEIRQAAFCVADVVDSVSGLFAVTAANKGVALECSLDPGVPAILIGDEMRVRQVLFNLVGNALKFTEKGLVRLEITALPAQDDEFPAHFCVKDTGIGIPEDRLSDIFEPFRQVENSYTRTYQGAGLGLAIVHRLIKLMHGSITIESTPGEGTSVHVVLPFKADRRTSPNTSKSASDRLGTGVRLLLVEDDPSNRFPTQRLLETAGHQVFQAENGSQAIEVLAENDIDCIFMDIQMPVMNGVEATRIIRNSPSLGPKQHVPIIALTAYAMDGDRETFLAAGMNGYVSKPATLEEMTRALRQVLKAPA